MRIPTKLVFSTLPIFLWLVVDLCPSAEALSCYFSTATNEERVMDCEHVFQIPSKDQMDALVAKDSTKYKLGKLACWKSGGFNKSCVLVASDQKMECAPATPKDTDVDKILAHVAQGAPASFGVLPARECFCDMDRCNSAPRKGGPLSPFLLFLFVGLSLWGIMG